MSSYIADNLWKALNVVLFFVIVYLYAKKPIKEMFEKAYKSLTSKVEEPLAHLLSTREAVSMAKQQVQEAKKISEQIINRQKMLAQEQYTEILQHADMVAKNVEERGKELIEVEANRLKSELLSGMSNILIQKAESKLKELFKDENTEISYVKSKLGRLA